MKKNIEILNINNKIGPDKSKTNITHTVNIDSVFDELLIKFSYKPKVLNDNEKAEKMILDGLNKYVPEEYKDGYGVWKDYMPLVNLLTLSIDCNGRYLGCAHRHNNNQTHVINQTFASPGFIKYKIEKGVWNFVINVHAVVTDLCEYELKVIGESKNNELVCK